MRLLSLSLILLAALAGCSHAPKHEPEPMATNLFGCPVGSNVGKRSMENLIDAKVRNAGDVSRVKVTEMRCRMQGDLIRIEATLVNSSSSVRRIAYRFEWLDDTGFKAADDDAWTPVMMYEDSTQTIVANSPTRKAADFRLVLLDQDKERK